MQAQDDEAWLFEPIALEDNITKPSSTLPQTSNDQFEAVSASHGGDSCKLKETVPQRSVNVEMISLPSKRHPSEPAHRPNKRLCSSKRSQQEVDNDLLYAIAVHKEEIARMKAQQQLETDRKLALKLNSGVNGKLTGRYRITHLAANEQLQKDRELALQLSREQFTDITINDFACLTGSMTLFATL